MKIHSVYDYNDPDFDMYKDGEEGDIIHFTPNNQEGIRFYRIVMRNGQRELEETSSSALQQSSSKKTKKRKRKTRRSVIVKARDKKKKKKKMQSKRLKISE
jgi:hypothetical protein